jgi:hypothetical protein
VAQTFEQAITVDLPAKLPPPMPDRRNVCTLLLRPGPYRLNLALKDVQSSKVGVIEESFTVPEYDDETLAASSLILSDKIETVSAVSEYGQASSCKDIGQGPFVVGTRKVHPSADEVFRRSGTLGFYMQIYNLTADQMTHRPSATIEWVLRKAGDAAGAKPAFGLSEKAADIPGAHPAQMTVARNLPLDRLAPGRYTLRVHVTDDIAKKSIMPAVSFTVR